MTQVARSRPVFAGPRLWALAREAYLSGETAQAVCDRFGLKKDALRAQANRHGWTKRAYADSLIDPVLNRMPRAGGAAEPGPADAPRVDRPTGPVDPVLLAHTVLSEAGYALANGRVAEAAAQLKMVESLTRLAEALPPPPRLAFSPEEIKRQQDEEVEAYRREVWEAAQKLAKSMLGDGGALPAVHTRAAFAWRAEHLGPGAAAADRAAAENGGWADSVYDAEGNLRPP